MAELFKLMGTISIDTTDAKQKIEGVIAAGNDLEGVLNQVGTNADKYIGESSGFGAASVWLGNMLSELTNRAAQLGKEFVLSGLKYNAMMEGHEVTFTTLLGGDAEKAKTLMEDIKKFALDSPLSVQGVSDAALQLLNVGTAYEDIMPMLEMLGDLSLGDASKMGKIATAMSQVLGFGQLYGQEKQQFVNASVPIYKLLEDYYKIVMGYDPADLHLDTMQKGGGIRSEHVLGALQLATMSDEEVLAKYGYSGERQVSYYGALNAMMPTYTGQMQKAGEQTEMAAGAVMLPFSEEIKNGTAAAYSSMMGAIGQSASEGWLGELLRPMATSLTTAAEEIFGGIEQLFDTSPAPEEQSGTDAVASFADYLTYFVNERTTNTGQRGVRFKDVLPNEFTGVWEIAKNLYEGVYLYRYAKAATSPDEETKGGAGRHFGTSSTETPSMEALADEYAGMFYRFGYHGKRLIQDLWDHYRIGTDPDDSGQYFRTKYQAGMEEIIDALNEQSQGYEFTSADEQTIIDGLYNFFSNLDTKEPNLPDSWFTKKDFDVDGTGGGGGGGIPALVASVQALTAAVQSMTGEIPSAITDGIGGISVTGTITTGDVTLDSGAIVGQLTPRLDLRLGAANERAARG